MYDRSCTLFSLCEPFLSILDSLHSSRQYDGIDGEAKDANHDKWIDVLSIDWGAHKPGGGMTGQSRRRGAPVVEDITLTVEYEKASPKLQDKCLKGEVIPKLEIEQTATTNSAGPATYLHYELKNVMVTSYTTNASGNDEAGPPTVVVGNNFEEVKVTYNVLDDCDPDETQCVTEFSYSIEKGGPRL